VILTKPKKNYLPVRTELLLVTINVSFGKRHCLVVPHDTQMATALLNIQADKVIEKTVATLGYFALVLNHVGRWLCQYFLQVTSASKFMLKVNTVITDVRS